MVAALLHKEQKRRRQPPRVYFKQLAPVSATLRRFEQRAERKSAEIPFRGGQESFIFVFTGTLY